MALKYKISVSEPWDFEGSTGENVIVGEIVKVLSSKCILFQSDALLKFNDYSGKTFILKSRYENQNLFNEDDYSGTVNGALLLVEEFDQLSEEELEGSSKYVLIGKLEKK